MRLTSSIDSASGEMLTPVGSSGGTYGGVGLPYPPSIKSLADDPSDDASRCDGEGGGSSEEVLTASRCAAAAVAVAVVAARYSW
jgi:hypothetical protein